MYKTTNLSGAYMKVWFANNAITQTMQHRNFNKSTKQNKTKQNKSTAPTTITYLRRHRFLLWPNAVSDRCGSACWAIGVGLRVGCYLQTDLKSDLLSPTRSTLKHQMCCYVAFVVAVCRSSSSDRLGGNFDLALICLFIRSTVLHLPKTASVERNL